MPMTRRDFLNACLGLGVIAVAGQQVVRAASHREQWYLFGTLVDVTLGSLDADEAASAFSALSAELQQRNRDWHPWRPGIMGNINSAIASSEPIAVDGHMAHMVSQCQRLHHVSGGTFNPAIGKIVAQWGFHGDSLERGQLPDRDVIARILATSPSPQDLHLQDGVLISRNTDVHLDFGGYAKGYAIDLGRRLLAQQGVSQALINAGGDLVTLGDAPDGEPWRVAIRHPQRDGQIAWLDVHGGEAVFTSGNYERYREYQGVRYPHIIDPRTGGPVQEIASATVVHHDAALADAAATALVVAGPEQWREVAEGLGVEQAMVVDAQGRIEQTLAMQERLELFT